MTCLSVHPLVCLSVSLSNSLHVHAFSAILSVCLSVCLSASVCLSVYNMEGWETHTTAKLQRQSRTVSLFVGPVCVHCTWQFLFEANLYPTADAAMFECTRIVIMRTSRQPFGSHFVCVSHFFVIVVLPIISMSCKL